MRSYRDIAAGMGGSPRQRCISRPTSCRFSQLRRMQKHLPFTDVRSVDEEVSAVRAVKSRYELCADGARREDPSPRARGPGARACSRKAIDEITFYCDLYSRMMKEGHQGIIRFGVFNEMVLGEIGFGTSTICPVCVDTPGGVAGMHPSVPQMGNRERKLRKGDLVVVDIGCGYNGYQTDKTLSYMFGRPIPEHAIEAHVRCVDIQDTAASMLKPGAIPSRFTGPSWRALNRNSSKTSWALASTG